jgi:hypothetical protein
MNHYGTTASILTTSSNLEESRKRLLRKLQKMTELPIGWSYGEGVPVSTQAISFAEKLVFLASMYELKSDVFPNLDGGCAVAVYAGSDRVEASINPEDCTIRLSAEHGIGFEYNVVIQPVENADLSEFVEQLSRLKIIQDKEWNSRGFLICDSSIEPVSGLEIPYLETLKSQPRFLLQTTAVGFRCLIPLVHVRA